MDFSLSDDQQLLLENLDELLERHASLDYIATLDREHRGPVELRKALHEAGYLTLGFPEEYGGTPADTLTILLVAERVARQGLNAAYGLELLEVKDILEFGSEEQKKAVLGELATGGVPFALAFSEPGAGSDSSALATTAEHKGSKVVFNGTKTLITDAVSARYLLTMAKNPEATDPRKAISMYLIPTASPGIALSPLEKILWHTTSSSEIYFDNVELEDSCLVGVKGNGFLQLMKNFEIERLMTSAMALGLAEAAFEDAATYAAQRVQFGQPIGNFQLIQEKLTDMAIKVENMRNILYHSAWMVDTGRLNRTQAAMCKRYCSMAGFEVCDDSLQVHGGIGVTEGTRISRLWRDARGHRFGGGTDEIMVHVIGRQIVKEHS